MLVIREIVGMGRGWQPWERKEMGEINRKRKVE